MLNNNRLQLAKTFVLFALITTLTASIVAQATIQSASTTSNTEAQIESGNTTVQLLAPVEPKDITVEQAEAEDSAFRADIPLSRELQASLKDACDRFNVPFELALAVIWRETRFQNEMGDSGNSYGYMQIQPRWHSSRMEALGVTDLMDPAQNFLVGCNYLGECIASAGIEGGLTLYNSGHDGPSSYADDVVEKYNEFLKED